MIWFNAYTFWLLLPTFMFFKIIESKEGTPAPSAGLSFHDIAALSRGNKPSVIERTIGAIFSKVALGPPVKTKNEYPDDIEKITTTDKPKETASNNVLQKLVTPKIGFDLDKWGFAGFKPREDPFQESIIIVTEDIKEVTTVHPTTSVEPEIPTETMGIQEKQQIRINVPKEPEITDVPPISTKIFPELVNEEVPQKPIISNVPVPTWTDDNQQREVAWRVHIYGTAILYLLVAIYAVSSLVQLAASISVRLLSRLSSAIVLAFVTLATVIRAAHLLHDPYASERGLHPAAGLVLFDLAFPCFSSAHVVLIISLLKVAELQVLPRLLQRLRMSVFVILFHFILTFVVDITAGYTAIGSLHLVSQAVFVLWTLTQCLGYFAAFGPVSRAAKGIEGQMRRSMTNSLHITSPKVPQRLPRPTLLFASKVTLSASICCLLIAALQLFSMFGTFSIPWKSHDSIISSSSYWSWWVFQFFARLMEVLTCLTMAIVASMPHSVSGKKGLVPVLQKLGCCVYNEKGELTAISPDLCSTKTLTLDDGQFPVVCGNGRQMKNYCYQQGPNEAYSAAAINGDILGLTTQLPQLKRVTLSPESEMYDKNSTSILYNDNAFGRVRDVYNKTDRPSYETIDELRGERSVYAIQTGRPLNDCRGCDSAYDCSAPCNYGYSCQRPVQERCLKNPNGSTVMENYVKLLLAARGENPSQDALPPEEGNVYVYNPQCPASTCSSESAANSFDMRLYGCPCTQYNHYHPLPKNGEGGLRPNVSRSPFGHPCYDDSMSVRRSRRSGSSPAKDLKVLQTAEMIRQAKSDVKCNRKETIIAVASKVKQPDASPDSAIVADYETKQQNLCSPFHEGMLKSALEQMNDKKSFTSSVSNFLKVSSAFSLNDIFKSEEKGDSDTNRKSIFDRLRGSQGSLTSSNYHYTPLQGGEEMCSDNIDALCTPSCKKRLLSEDSTLKVSSDATDSTTPCWLSPGVLRRHTERLSHIEGLVDHKIQFENSDMSTDVPSDSKSFDGLSDLSRLNDSSEVESIL
ncbi:uncharacterized protein LOC136026678 [Artemia franciscana]|uniref:Proline-rich transmembrane protein 3/4 domain-containing protein n=1 Tax=Artemia franciscana TaxID=6661 RepID=A0AA88LI60_ARTSF|nr:hypothetical protein QYM36_008463 [Artemia franciscana]